MDYFPLCLFEIYAFLGEVLHAKTKPRNHITITAFFSLTFGAFCKTSFSVKLVEKSICQSRIFLPSNTIHTLNYQVCISSKNTTIGMSILVQALFATCRPKMVFLARAITP